MVAAEAAVAAEGPREVSAARRLAIVDALRGVVIVLMALDHTRDFFHVRALFEEPTDLATTTAALFATRWITHLCAPVFVALAGVSAWLQRAAGKPPGALARYLALRGLWLIALDLTVVSATWSFDLANPTFQVLGALGVGMLVLAALVHAPRGAVLAAGLVIVAGHNLLDGISAASLGAFGPAWRLLHEPGLVPTTPQTLVMYPVLPWVGLMLVGYGFGPLALCGWRGRWLVGGGAGLLTLFALLRLANGYGDPAPWTPQPTALFTALSFLNVTKYPPSLDYLAATIGAALIVAAALRRLPAAAFDALQVYGRVPLFFYLAHAPLIHAAALGLGALTGYPPAAFVGAFATPERLAGFGLPLAGVYAVWACALALLYPACRAWGRLKATRRDAWLSYL